MSNSRSRGAINTRGGRNLFFSPDWIADTAAQYHILHIGAVFYGMCVCVCTWDWGERGADRNISPFQFVEEDSSSCLKGQAVAPEVEIITELSGNIIAP